MSLIEQSLSTIRKAVIRFKKKPLADKAGVSDSLLRNAHDADWDPRSTTLRRLEKAAAELEKEHGPGDTPNPAHAKDNGKSPRSKQRERTA